MVRPRLRVGVQLPEVERVVGWREYAEMARAAEEADFDSVWIGDHLLYRGDGRQERGPWDAWSVLAALAASTQRLRLGPLVACTAFAPAGQIARRAAAVQEISGGRLVLGLGAGWNRAEFEAFGIPMAGRASRFVESYDAIRRLLVGERVSVDGRFEQLRDAVVLPRPPTPPVLMIGSTGERVLRATLPTVDAWNIWHDWYGNTPDGFARANARITAMLDDVGRPPTDVVRSATVSVVVGDAQPDRPHDRDAPPLGGPPEAVAARLRQLYDAGVDEAILVVTPITEDSIRTLGAAVAAISSG